MLIVLELPAATRFSSINYNESLRERPDVIVGTFGEAVTAVLEAPGKVLASNQPPCLSSAKRMNTYLLEKLPIKILSRWRDEKGIAELYRKPFIRGLTTNPTLMRKAGIAEYEKFARSVLGVVKDKPISFEVFSDEFNEMRRQALKISQWQDNVYVKIPITNTRGDSAIPLIRDLGQEGVQLNITAILTRRQVEAVADALNSDTPAFVSVFAGRIPDTGVDPIPVMRDSLELLTGLPAAELLWASVREVLNIFQAADCGCHIVTVPHDILAKVMKLGGMELEELSLDTVRMFHQDAVVAGFSL